jgi:hypothetical protein
MPCSLPDNQILVRAFLMLLARLSGVVRSLRPPLLLLSFPHKFLVADHLANDLLRLSLRFLL